MSVTHWNFPLPLFSIHPSEYCKVKLLSNFDKIFLLTIFQFLSSEKVGFYFQNQNFLIISHISDISFKKYRNLSGQGKGKRKQCVPFTEVRKESSLSYSWIDWYRLKTDPLYHELTIISFTVLVNIWENISSKLA